MPLPQFESAGHNAGHEHHRMLGFQPFFLELNAGWIGQRTRYGLGYILREGSGHCVVEEKQEPPSGAYEADKPATAIDTRPLGSLRLRGFLPLSVLFLIVVPVNMRLRVRGLALSAPQERHRVAEDDDAESERASSKKQKVEAFKSSESWVWAWTASELRATSRAQRSLWWDLRGWEVESPAGMGAKGGPNCGSWASSDWNWKVQIGRGSHLGSWRRHVAGCRQVEGPWPSAGAPWKVAVDGAPIRAGGSQFCSSEAMIKRWLRWEWLLYFLLDYFSFADCVDKSR